METYEFLHPDQIKDTVSQTILQYDYMPARIVSVTLFMEPVYAANVFPIDENGMLKYVSVMTVDLNTEVTVSVYKLREDAADPEDGVLLGRTSERFQYGGYHRIRLPDHLVLRQGERIGVTVLESVPISDGIRYAFVNTSSPGEKAPEELARRHPDGDVSLSRYAVGVVNPGESFVKFPGEDWMDWKDALSVIGNSGNRMYVAYDNLPVKGYLYPLHGSRMN